MFQYNTIEEALEDLRQGRMILCTDDPDRENEGDLICAAEFATTENVNFMATHAKGLICTPMSAEIADRLGLEQKQLQQEDREEPRCWHTECFPLRPVGKELQQQP